VGSRVKSTDRKIGGGKILCFTSIQARASKAALALFINDIRQSFFQFIYDLLVWPGLKGILHCFPSQ
ncbi:MAG: hypothetical protein KDD19_06455, partial [Phaeodactylibacter sp.]|nr:hypothetical protein [Phaeodactylibacter sp.]